MISTLIKPGVCEKDIKSQKKEVVRLLIQHIFFWTVRIALIHNGINTNVAATHAV